MKQVAAGAHYTTVTVDTAEAVKFSFPSTSLSVEAAGGDITVALTDTAQAGDDETITVPDGESRMFIHHRMGVDTYYLAGSGTAKLYASNMGDVNPFKGKSKGGDAGGDNTHYKGTTTTPLANGSTTNPIVIDGESYTAVFGDVVVYGYTEFVFDGTTWSEFGRPFDTVPTQGSTNAVTSDGVYRNTAGRKYYVNGEYKGTILSDYYCKATGNRSVAEGYGTTASGDFSHSEGSSSAASNTYSHAEGQATTAGGGSSHAEGRHTVASGSGSHATGFYTIANKENSTAIGKYNVADTDVAHLLIVGNGTEENTRSNILEVSETDMNVNGDIKRDGVGIDDYTTTERKIGKWIDGSDLYQRTFEVTGLTQGQWNNAALGTSNIDIKYFDGYIRYLYNGEFNRNIPLNYYGSSNDYVVTQNMGSDLAIKPNRTESGLAIDKAIITIKYTKPSVQANTLNANIQQTEEPTDENR